MAVKKSLLATRWFDQNLCARSIFAAGQLHFCFRSASFHLGQAASVACLTRACLSACFMLTRHIFQHWVVIDGRTREIRPPSFAAGPSSVIYRRPSCSAPPAVPFFAL